MDVDLNEFNEKTGNKKVRKRGASIFCGIGEGVMGSNRMTGVYRPSLRGAEAVFLCFSIRERGLRYLSGYQVS